MFVVDTEMMTDDCDFVLHFDLSPTILLPPQEGILPLGGIPAGGGGKSIILFYPTGDSPPGGGFLPWVEKVHYNKAQ